MTTGNRSLLIRISRWAGVLAVLITILSMYGSAVSRVSAIETRQQEHDKLEAQDRVYIDGKFEDLKTEIKENRELIIKLLEGKK
jgi:hypothetical protein